MTISSQCPPDDCSIDCAKCGAYEDLQVISKQVAPRSLATYLLYSHIQPASKNSQFLSQPNPVHSSSIFACTLNCSAGEICAHFRRIGEIRCVGFALHESPELSSGMISGYWRLSTPQPGPSPRVIHACSDSILIKSVDDGELSHQSTDPHKSRLNGITHRGSHDHAPIWFHSNFFR